jgi:ubiquinone/menaquinone biosynthesis C-methylase UbiE
MNAKGFHTKMATGYFKPIYPVIAKNIIKKSPLKRGVCLDIGCGSGCLGVEIARISNFTIYNIDSNEEFVNIAKAFALKSNLSHRVKVVKGKAEHIPLHSNSVELIVSRGSIYFWDDKIKGLHEVYRVLKPGGFACIGGGMGSTALANRINQQLKEDTNWQLQKNERFRKNLPIHQKILMKESGIPNWEMESSQEGTWIMITK